MFSCIRCTGKGFSPNCGGRHRHHSFSPPAHYFPGRLYPEIRSSRPIHKFPGRVAYALCMSIDDDNITRFAKPCRTGLSGHIVIADPCHTARCVAYGDQFLPITTAPMT